MMATSATEQQLETVMLPPASAAAENWGEGISDGDDLKLWDDAVGGNKDSALGYTTAAIWTERETSKLLLNDDEE